MSLSTNIDSATIINSEYSTPNNDAPQITESKNFFKQTTQNYQGVITTLILFSLCLLNISDRYIIGSVLTDVQAYFNVSKSTAGLLQTIFLLFYMAFSPLNGYLGDRINRKYMLITSMVLWITSTIGGSFAGSKQFYLFVLSRCLFGIATASFETIAVPIIGDRFASNSKNRIRSLMIINLGPPIGTGLAYLIGLVAKDLAPNDWRFSMRFTPILLIIILIAVIFCYIEPDRGNKESDHIPSSFLDDLKVLLKNKTYVLLLFSWTAGLASLGGFNWWSATIIDYSLTYENASSEKKDTIKKIYSIMQIIVGVIGLYIPCEISKVFKRRFQKIPIDCFLLSAGFFGSSIFTYFYLLILEYNIYISTVFFMLAVASFNMGWVIQAQILLDIVRPQLRSTGNALIICILHLIGDSVSPYWMGLIAEHCIDPSRRENTISNLLECTQLSFYPLVFLSFIASTLALFMTLTFYKDKENAH